MHIFERITEFVIAGNVAVVIFGLFFHGAEDVLEHVHTGILCWFVVELLVRLHMAGWNPVRFFSDRWAIFDTAVVLLSLLPDLLGGSALRAVRLARIARLAHLVRHISTLRIIELWMRPAFRRG